MMQLRPWMAFGLAAALLLPANGCGYAAIAAIVLQDDDDDDPLPTTTGAANQPPVANVSTPTGTQGSDVAISYFLTDAENEAADIVVTYESSSDGGTVWSAPAAATEATGGGTEGTTGLAAASTGSGHLFVWDSLTDLGMVNVLVRLTIAPETPGTPPVAGVSGTTAVGGFTVNNVNLVPVVAIAPIGGNQSNTVPITYTLSDAENDTADVLVEYAFSPTGTWIFPTPWTTASEVPGLPSEGTSGLAAPSTGAQHVFVWNAFADLGGVTGFARVRITPIDPAGPRNGTPVETGLPGFPILNNLIGTVTGGGQSILSFPSGMARSGAGHIYIADTNNHQVQVLNTSGSAITVTGVSVAANSLAIIGGTGVAGFNGDNLLGTAAQLNFPRDIALDGAGNVYIADALNHRIRRIDATTGFITSVAGNGTPGRNGDNGLATSAQVNLPSGIDFDSSGNLFISDSGNHILRVINYQSSAITVSGVNVNPNFIARFAGSAIALPGNNGDGNASTLCLLNEPWGLAENNGLVYVADKVNHCVRVVNTTASNVTTGAFTVNAGNIETAAGTNGTAGFSGDAGASKSATLREPRGIDTDSSGNLYIADTRNNRLRIVNTQSLSSISRAGITISAGQIDTIAGGGTPGIGDGDTGGSNGSVLSLPEGVVVLANDHAAIADTGGERVRAVNVGSSGNITIAGVTIAATNIDAIAGSAPTVNRVLAPSGVIRSGTALYIADRDLHVVSRYGFKSGSVTPVAGKVGSGPGFSGDAGPATSAQMQRPGDIALTSKGNLVIADSANNRIRIVNLNAGVSTNYKVTVAAGNIDTVFGGGAGGNGSSGQSAQLRFPTGLAIGANDKLYVAAFAGASIREIDDGTGVVATTAGSGTTGYTDGARLTLATFDQPTDVFVDALGNLLVADSNNQAIRYVNLGAGAVTVATVSCPAGSVTTIAGIAPGQPGAGTPFFNGDNQSGTATFLHTPTAVVRSPAGDIFFVDSGNQRIRKLTHTTGLVSTVAGTGSPGYNGDGIPPVNAHLNNPTFLTLDAATPANLFFSDASNRRVRRFTP